MNRIRTVKHFTLTAGLLALSAVPGAIFAQDAPQGTPQGQDQAAPPQSGRMHDNELAKLNLSEDQKAQVKKIHMDARAQMDAVQGDASLSADQKQAKMQQIHKATHEQVKQVLTPEQRKQMKADEMARKAARQGGGEAPPPQR